MSTTAADSIHGHEVIAMIHSAATPFNRQTLAVEVARRFGSEARFHTCSPGRMTLDQLLDLLVAKGKLCEAGGVLRMDMSKVCGHGEH